MKFCKIKEPKGRHSYFVLERDMRQFALVVKNLNEYFKAKINWLQRLLARFKSTHIIDFRLNIGF